MLNNLASVTDLVLGDAYSQQKMGLLIKELTDLANTYNSFILQQVYAAKPAATTRTGTVLTNDPDLVLPLKAPGTYHIRGAFGFLAAAGIKIGLAAASAGVASSGFIWTWNGTGSGNILAMGFGSNFTDTTNVQNQLIMSGYVQITAQSVLAVDWASNTSGQNATLDAGGLLAAQRVA